MSAEDRAEPAFARHGPWLAAFLGVLVTGGLGYAAAQALWSPGVAFLVERAPARWIAHPIPPTAHIRSGEFIAAVTEFRRTFRLAAAAPESARLHVRAFDRFELRVNGIEVAARDPERSWKATTTVPVAHVLRPGTNEIRVRVTSNWGPAALWLSPDDVPGAPSTDASWTSSLAGGSAEAARIADDTRLFPPVVHGPRPWRALREHAFVLLALFGLLVLSFRGLHVWSQRDAAPRGVRALRPHAAEAVLAISLLAWAALAVHNLPLGSPHVGFDAPSHIAYVEHLLEHRALPQTDQAMEPSPDGALVPRWESHQPPLFYAISAVVLAAARALVGPEAAEHWLRFVSLLSGAGLVLVAWAAARAVFPASVAARAAAVGFVGFAPMNLYIGHYVTNESLSALWIGAALASAVALLVQPRPGLRGFVVLGLVSGLALMTKATYAATFPLVLGALAYKLLLRDGFEPRRVAARLAVTLAIAVPIGGWFWLRSWILFGTPLVLPWEGQMGFDWWQDPGFHTAGYFLRFGEVFDRPWFVGTRSFLDSLYATFWGDGFVGGMPGFGHPLQPPWRYDWMATLYPLAVPATLLLGAGAIVAARRVAVQGSAAWTLLLAATFLAGLSLLMMNLRIPYFAQAKSFYALGAMIPLGLLAGAGFGWLDERLHAAGRHWLRACLRAYGATLAIVVVVSFWAVAPG